MNLIPGPFRDVRRAAVLAAAAALLLSSCGQDTPGMAADVDGTTISDSKVDDFALVLCALGGLPGQTDAGTPSKDARFRSLQILLGNQLALDVADVDNVDQAAVNAAVQQLNGGRENVPENVRATFDQVVEEYAHHPERDHRAGPGVASEVRVDRADRRRRGVHRGRPAPDGVREAGRREHRPALRQHDRRGAHPGHRLAVGAGVRPWPPGRLRPRRAPTWWASSPVSQKCSE